MTYNPTGGYGATIVDQLASHVSRSPLSLAYRFLGTGDSNDDVQEWTYFDLDRRSRAIAARLYEAGGQQERALLLYPPGLEFIAAFLGCLRSGVIAVPAYAHRTLPRIRAIVRDCAPRYVLGTATTLSSRSSFIDQAPELENAVWLATDEIPDADGNDWNAVELPAEALAFLQYTSGSTGDPKGVMVSHANIMANERCIAEGFRNLEDTHVVGWLPVYHDMGLIGNVLQPLYLGGSATLMAPAAFLQRPRRWLEAVSRYGGTVSGGPNFAFDLCVRKIPSEERVGFDLRTWRIAFCGSEPIRAKTLETFADAFEACGFRRSALYPCYGMAETTLYATGSNPALAPRYKTVNSDELSKHIVGDALPSSAKAITLTSCGEPARDHHLLVVDPETRAPLGSGSIGEIWVNGPSIALGYWQRPALNDEIFGATLVTDMAGRYLRTGDLGFVDGGELFITGRRKDLIIIRGRNLYPQDIELSVEDAHDAIRPDGSAAFAFDIDGEERLGIVAEVSLRAGDPRIEEIIGSIRLAVAEQHGVHAYAVALLRTRGLPKTSSGKVQRHACKARYLDGSLPVVATSSIDTVAGSELEISVYGTSISEQLAASSDALARRELVENLVRRQVARIVRVSVEGVRFDTAPASLGLDSLNALELQTRLEDAIGSRFENGWIWKHSTVQALVEDLLTRLASSDSSSGGSDDDVLPNIIPAGELVPLGSGAERLYLLQDLAAEAPVYNVHFGLELVGPLDVRLLETSVTELLKRHTALRSVVDDVDGRLYQRVLAPEAIRLGIVNLSDAVVPEDELKIFASQWASVPFDLRTGPLTRWQLVRVDAEKHVLVVCQHHVVTDGWSVSRLGAELAGLYRARVDGSPEPVMSRLQYADYAQWERNRLSRQSDDYTYWRDQLRGIPQLSLPRSRISAERRTYRGARISFAVDMSSASRLLTIGRSEGCTTFVTMLAAFSLLLSVSSGQDDFAVGTVVANRDRSEFRDVIGFLANTVAIRCQIDGSPTFRDILHITKAKVAGALAHAALPFAEVVRTVGDGRLNNGNPIFQAAFILESNPFGEFEVGAMRWKPLNFSPDGAVDGTAKFDLSLVLEEFSGSVRGHLEYDADLFDRADMSRLMERFATLIRTVADQPAENVRRLQLLSPSEAQPIRVGWNPVETPLPQGLTTLHLFEERAIKEPDAVAATDNIEAVSYGELNERANRLARWLQGEGIGPNDVVALLAQRSIAFLTAILAVWKAGGAYLPLEPDDPPERHRQILAQSRAAYLITSREQLTRLDMDNGEWNGRTMPPVLLVESFLAIEHSAANLEPHPTPSDLAYVIFTSGSTGKPKGAMVEHLGMLNHLLAKIRDLQLDEDDTVAQTASQAFDISVWQFFAPLLVGGRVAIVSRENATDAENLFPYIASCEVTVLEIVPSLLGAVIESAEAGFSFAVMPGTLRWLMLTGEALPPSLVKRWFRWNPGVSLVNAYGPTECSDDVTHHIIKRNEAYDIGSVPIGQTIINTRLYVLDRWGQPVPVGVPGELHVGGLGVGRGYLDDPVRTAQAFVPDHLSGVSGARLYRTGDLVCVSQDGLFSFLGRIDHQVKIRGFRVELGEVESALLAMPAVAAAVVTALESGLQAKRLIAYVVLREPISSNLLRSLLQGRLPDYMVPSAFVTLDALPLTPNGKIDRRALPDPSAGLLIDEAGFVAPRTVTEEVLAEIWGALLGLPRIGIHDNFFELGGHSLLGMQLIARIRNSLGVAVPLRSLFEGPSIAEMAKAADAARGTVSLEEAELRRVSRDGPISLSFAQQRLWFLDQLAPGEAFYNVPGVVRIRGALDEAALG
ncbi:non-ribosomal peptide synthetase, partial [Rhizobium rhizogenes]|uniref:non-ribosomal peptide synthetase n=1 Tax=Rhizobium rhizogenes TaxID=359 RepID=UPI0015737D6A